VHIWQRQPNKKFGIKTYIVSLSVILAGLWMLVYYPAVMISDATDQWQQAIEDKYNDWHPPLLAFLMRVNLNISNSPSLLAFVQAVLLFIAVYTFTYYLLEYRSVNYRIRLGVLCLIPLIPLLWNNSVTFFRDVWLAISVLWMLICIQKLSKTKSKIAGFCYSLLFGIALSFGLSFIFYLPFFAWNTFHITKLNFHRRFLIPVFTILVLIPLFLPFSISTAMNATKTHQEAKIFLFEIIGTAIHTKDSNFQEFQEILEPLKLPKKIISKDTLRQLYRPNYGDSYVWVTPSTKPIFNQDLVYSANDKLLSFLVYNCVLKHPIPYFKHKLEVWSYLFGLHGPQDAYASGIFENKMGLVSASMLPRFQQFILSKVLPFPGISLFFIPGVYVLLLGLMVIRIFRRKRINDRLFIIYSNAIYVSLSLIVSYMFLTPVSGFRYLYPSCLIILLLAIVSAIPKSMMINQKYNVRNKT